MAPSMLAHVRKELSKSQRQKADTACPRVSPCGGGTGRGSRQRRIGATSISRVDYARAIV